MSDEITNNDEAPYYQDQHTINGKLHPCVSQEGMVIAVCPLPNDQHIGMCGHLDDLITMANQARAASPQG